MSLHRYVHVIRLGFKSLSMHRLRSALTVLGVVLGVASVIVMLAVGEAARYQAIQQIKDLGASNIIVRSIKPIDDLDPNQSRGMIHYGLTSQDLERIRGTIPTVESVTPMREFRKELRHRERKLEGRVVAATPNFLELNGLRMSRGRFLNEVDNDDFANVAVLAGDTAEVLFPVEDPIGHSVQIGESHFYTVIGVTQRRAPSAGIGSSLAAQDYNRDVYIPYDTDKVRFGKIVTYQRAGTYQAEKLEISQLTVTVDRMEHVKKTADIIQGLLEQFHTQKDFAITVPLDLLEKAEQTQRIFTLVLGAIASISLVVGGVGIMNIMLATVTERTREIGIRRALGAKRRHIALQFLVETLVLSCTGGILGVGLGLGVTFLVTRCFGFPLILQLWSPLLAFGVSVAVGLIFGSLPARRASRMDPIQAMRHS